jgi:predicted phosphate transport protein (TIGR00153 family)
MLGKKKSSEKDARQRLEDHINKVGEVLQKTMITLECYFNGQIEPAKTYAKEVDKLETEADDILRGFMVCLQQGAFMPLIRKDIFQVISAVDKVANAAESTCDFSWAQRPQIHQKFCEAFEDIIRANVKMFPDLNAAVDILKLGTFGMAGDMDTNFYDIAQNISVSESNVDELEWKLTRDIFSSDIPLANKMHLHELLNHITRISDLIEDVADRIQIMITREVL